VGNNEYVKKHIAEIIKKELKCKGLSYREAANRIENFSYTQLTRITGSKNYSISTLGKVLELLDLEIIIKEKGDN